MPYIGDDCRHALQLSDPSFVRRACDMAWILWDRAELLAFDIESDNATW